MVMLAAKTRGDGGGGGDGDGRQNEKGLVEKKRISLIRINAFALE